MLFHPPTFSIELRRGCIIAKFRELWADVKVRSDVCKIIFELGASEGREEDPVGDVAGASVSENLFYVT
jgi:hypothetical protein